MKSIVLIACILAYAVAQQPTLVHLTNGTTVSGSLGVSADSETAEKKVDYYAYQIPANVDVITVNFNPDPTDNSPCTYLYYFFSVATIPCSSLWSEGTGNFLPCQEAEYSYASSATEIVIRAGEFYDVTAFEPGTTLYFTVGKQGYNSDDVCPYTISIGNSNCTASQVGLYDDSDESICVPVTDLTFPASWEVTLPANDRVVYRFPVSQLTGNVHIAINSTYYVYAYGGYNYPYNSNYYSAPCYDSSNYEGNGEYSLDLYCGQPKKGWFYLTLLQSGSGSANATVSVSSLPCAANAGGVWCQHFAQNYTDSAPVNRTIRAYNSSIDSSSFYPGDFYYVNYPAGTLANVNFTVCNGANSLTVTYRKDGFPFSGSYSTSVGAFECLTVVIRPEDTYIGGSYVVGVINPSSTTVASYQISKAAASFDSTTGQTTEGDGSGAAALVAPVVMVIAMLALLF